MFSKQAVPVSFDNNPIDVAKFHHFQKKFHSWIHSSKQIVNGLPENKTIVSGITDAFNQLYGLYNSIGILPGEYGYHNLVLKNRITHDLSNADCIVISHPFSADGFSSHEKLEIADTLNKPIFVDCAFFGMCSNIDFDFSKYKNIKSVCFSLSKTFGTGLRRVGLLYSHDPFPAFYYNQWSYPLITNALYHYELIDRKSPDFIAEIYKDKQIEVCKKHQLIPSDTIIFGIDTTDRFPDYKRGTSNRVCITKLLTP